jgi:putative membrane protein
MSLEKEHSVDKGSDKEHLLSDKGNPSDHLANERTLLAWVRTGIGIMAFGFVVVKFSLFVKQISLALGNSGKPGAVQQHGYSAPIGILLVVTGALSLLLALLRYKRTERQLMNKQYEHSSVILYTIVVVLLIVSAILIAYLIEST